MTLRAKLLFPFVLFLLSSVVFLRVFWYPEFKAYEENDLKQQEQEYLEMLATTLLPDILVGDYAKVYETLNAVLQKRAHIKEITLKDADQNQLYPLSQHNGKTEGVLYTTSHTLCFQGETIAEIVAGIRFDSLIERKLKKIRVLEITLFVILSIMAVFSLIFQDLFIRKPLSKLADATTKIASGEFDVAPFKISEDEIGRFTRAFDDMRQKLQDRENRLASSEKRRTAIIENTIESIISIDERGIILSVNKATEKMFGYFQKELLGNKVNMLMPEPYNLDHDGYLKRYVESNDPHVIGIGREIWAQRKDGGVFPIRLSVTEVILENERLFTGLIMDITNQKEQEEELRRHRDNLAILVDEQTEELIAARDVAEKASLAKSAFLANMSHEIRTPMNSVLGYLALSIESEVLPEAVTKYLETSYSSAKSLLALLNDILDVSKLESGKFQLDNTVFSFSALLKEVLAAIEIRARNKGLQFTMEAKDLPECCRGDSVRLRQILLNLLENAVKFTPEGQVVLSVDQVDEEFFHFAVQDTGIGISKHQAETIFEPFTQADSSTTRNFGGTGLGITISKDLVELMGGRIWLESELGKGSTFHITVRLIPADCDEIVKPRDDVPVLVELTRKLNILVVEDIEENAMLVTIRLEMEGQNVTLANNGIEAVEAFKNGQFDLILMDVQMPVMDGLEATRVLRELEKETGTHVPIIAMTASVMRNDVESCQRAGMDSFVGKPLDFQKLFLAIKHEVSDESGEALGRNDLKVRHDEKVKRKFPVIRGIDTEAGMKNWKDSSAYENALVSFAENYQGSAHQLKEYLDNGKKTEAYSISHSLKGVSGNLMAYNIYDAVKQFVVALKKDEAEILEDSLKNLAIAVSDTSNNIQIAFNREAPGASTEVITDVVRVRSILINLLAALNSDEPDKVEPVLYTLQGQIPGEVYLSFCKLINDYDFREAEKEIEHLLSRLIDDGVK